MADVAAGATGAAGVRRNDDPAHRGTLTIRQRAVERIAATAASRTAGVQRHGNALGRWTGRELPRVDVVVAGDHVRAAVEVAVDWGQSLAAVAAAVRTDVTTALAGHSGLTVDGVSVHVGAVIAPGEGRDSARRVS